MKEGEPIHGQQVYLSLSYFYQKGNQFVIGREELPTGGEEAFAHYFNLGLDYGFRENLIFSLNFPLRKINSEKTDENARFTSLGDITIFTRYKLWQADTPVCRLEVPSGAFRRSQVTPDGLQ